MNVVSRRLAFCAASWAVGMAGALPAAEPAPAAFSASRADLAFLGPLELGLVVVRPSELASRPDFAPAVKLIEAFAQTQVVGGAAAETVKAPVVRLAAIDYIAYAWHTESANEVAPADGGGADRAAESLGVDVAIRFVEAVDFQAWLKENAPKVEEAVAEGVTYFRNSPEAPDPGMVAVQIDPQTVLFSTRVERLLWLAKPAGLPTAGDDDGTWAEQWAGVDGGLMTAAIRVDRMASRVITVDGEFENLAAGLFGMNAAPGQPNPLEIAFRNIGDGTRTVCLGLDLDPAIGDVCLRSSLGCPDYATAKQVRDSLAVLQSFAKEYVKALQGAAVAGAAGDAFAQMYVDVVFLGFRLFGEAEPDFRLHENESVDVWLEARGPLPESFALGMAALGAAPDGLVQPAAAEAPADQPGPAAPR